MPRDSGRHVATLWDLVWNGNRLRCAIYRAGRGHRFELRLLSATTVVFAEPLEIGPRMLSRTRALKRSLVRRGWREEREPREPR